MPLCLLVSIAGPRSVWLPGFDFTKAYTSCHFWHGHANAVYKLYHASRAYKKHVSRLVYVQMGGALANLESYKDKKT